jgi:hypothetical protein
MESPRCPQSTIIFLRESYTMIWKYLPSPNLGLAAPHPHRCASTGDTSCWSTSVLRGCCQSLRPPGHSSGRSHWWSPSGPTLEINWDVKTRMGMAKPSSMVRFCRSPWFKGWLLDQSGVVPSGHLLLPVLWGDDEVSWPWSGHHEDVEERDSRWSPQVASCSLHYVSYYSLS